MSERVTIDIWSDVMCPWCLVGWGQLSRALETLEGEIDAEIRWLPFELNPDMPEEGEERTAHIARKYGRTMEQSHDVQGHMRAMAEEAGVSLDYSGGETPEPAAMMWNTFLAHKLLGWALATAGTEAQTRLKLALFAAHFHHRRKIGEAEVLLDIAAEEGFDRAEAAAALADEQLGQMIRMEERHAFDLNITGVPAMVVDGKFQIPGAQGAETYETELRRVVAKRAS
ncbi:DsbA family oxidoreductase [Alteriqipengyuania flavescens]|uniref:DsbA family oxidoreductase n=1 Tax=Alteriqipengyuania flavescens TaxID=3053610 RepID=UPI0025B465F6|nr:DsbA family oxidoreductase [Alteriqipengyuania flavescens]WJY18812.1 DsbA family oxidoreductase [Alteriqipengyuania flavescens]WJY24752.1 DsbA family oxidoreductase [Alteriqipengyuania flavescens]